MIPLFSLARRPAVAVFALALLSAPVLPGQEPHQLSASGRQAVERLESDDLSAAVALLEPLVEAGAATPLERAILGGVYLELGRAAAALDLLRPLTEGPEADPAVLFNASRAARAVGEGDLADRFLARAAELAPVSPAGRERGLQLGARGEIAESYRLLRGWVAVEPGDQEARLAAATGALRLGRAAEAERLLTGMPEGDPGVSLLLGQLALQRGEPQGALERFEALLAETGLPAGMRGDLLLLAADAYIQVGRSQDAVDLLADRGRSRPRLAAVLAEALHRTGDAAAAAAVLEPWATPLLGSAAEDDLSFQLVLDYARMLTAAGRPAEAVPYAELATRLRPEISGTWKALRDALAAAGRREEAIEALARFQELAPLDAERRKRAEGLAADPVARALAEAQTDLQGGRSEQALARLRQEVALSSGDLRPHVGLVRALLALERPREALEAAEAAYVAFPDHPDVVYQRGVTRLAAGAVTEAEEDLRRALELAPEHPAALNDLAVLHMMQGDEPAARRLLERALAINPQDPVATRNLADLERRGGG